MKFEYCKTVWTNVYIFDFHQWNDLKNFSHFSSFQVEPSCRSFSSRSLLRRSLNNSVLFKTVHFQSVLFNRSFSSWYLSSRSFQVGSFQVFNINLVLSSRSLSSLSITGQAFPFRSIISKQVLQVAAFPVGLFEAVPFPISTFQVGIFQTVLQFEICPDKSVHFWSVFLSRSISQVGHFYKHAVQFKLAPLRRPSCFDDNNIIISDNKIWRFFFFSFIFGL